MRKVAILSVMLVMVMCWAFTASAAITVYTEKTQWENALGVQFLTEDFSDSVLNVGVSFESTESGHINPALEIYQDVLASASQNEPMTTWSFTPEVFGYGGNWTLGGPGGSGNSLLVSIADSSTFVGAISNNYNGGFWGFISDTPFTSVKLVGGGGSNQQNYSLDDMVYSFLGDLDGDGFVGITDLNIVLGNWNQNVPPANPAADPSGDGFIGIEDLNVVLGNWNAGTPPGDTANIPEPTTLMLLLVGSAVLSHRKR